MNDEFKKAADIEAEIPITVGATTQIPPKKQILQVETLNKEQIELLEAFTNTKICFWNGLPPCPKCGQDHGDPKCTPEQDIQYREEIIDVLRKNGWID